MKYIIVLTDGMSDFPIEKINNKTPMEYAYTPNLDNISRVSFQGLASTVPKGMDPGSDIANLSIMGYDPSEYYTGRSSIEASGIGIKMKDSDLSLRTNFVTIEPGKDYDDSIMIDHGADDISSEEAYELLDAIKSKFDSKSMTFFKGMSYRHILIISNKLNEMSFSAPHDILNQKITDHLPKGPGSEELYKMMRESHKILKHHKINKLRIEKGLNPANSIWFWGPGTKMIIPSFKDKTGLNGGIISAVDLLKGIGRSADMRIIDVEGANGTIHTNYEGKVSACIENLASGLDFIYLHIEAPDECGHKGDLEDKIRSIELIDEKIIGQILKSKEKIGPFKMMVLPDHPTPISLRTHSSDPVPFLIYEYGKNHIGFDTFSEKNAKESGIVISKGHELLNYFIKK